MSGPASPDPRILNAAAGWLGLGLPAEARKELDQLSPAERQHPEALSLDWDILARERHWDDALAVANRILETNRDHPGGWINRSYALHELRRTAEARDALLLALPRFPELGVIPYNLACYACQLGQLDEARTWLRQAMEVDGREVVIRRARQDRDLIALYAELERI